MAQPPTKTQQAPGSVTVEHSAPLPGQIAQPNPLELYWEKNKRTIILVVVLFFAVIGGRNLWQYLQRQKRNQTWSKLTAGTGIRESYAPQPPAEETYFDLIWSPFEAMADNLRKTEPAAFESTAKALEGTSAEAVAQWMLACRLALDGSVDVVRGAADRAVASAAQYAAKLDYPPVYVAPPEPPADAATPPRPEELEPKEPPPASLRDLVIERAQRTADFRARRADLYSAPEPDAKPEIVFETTKGIITVRLYSKLAPKHCEQFVKNCKAGVYADLRIHQIHKKGLKQPDSYQGDFAVLGDPASKDDDRTKWGQFNSPEQTPPEAGASHFPYVLAAWRGDKLGSDQQLVYFTASDCAEWRDGKYVVFGRAVDEASQQVLREICAGKLSSNVEDDAGVGKPADPVKIVKVTVNE